MEAAGPKPHVPLPLSASTCLFVTGPCPCPSTSALSARPSLPPVALSLIQSWSHCPPLADSAPPSPVRPPPPIHPTLSPLKLSPPLDDEKRGTLSCQRKCAPTKGHASALSALACGAEHVCGRSGALARAYGECEWTWRGARRPRGCDGTWLRAGG